MNDVSNKIFIIAGMPRTGTTFLYHNLKKHPSLFLPYRKELNYFSVNFERGSDWYLQFYQELGFEEFGADISPCYFLHPDAIERIKTLNPNTKVILAVREPADWALSLYNHLLTYNWQLPTFENFIEGYLFNPGNSNKKVYIALKNELIIQRIESYRKAFGENLLLYHYDFFKENPLNVLHSIENFVGLKPYFNENNFDNIVINAGNRINIKIVTYLLNREEVVFLMKTMFHRKALHFFQNVFAKVSKEKKGKNLKVYSPENVQLAKQVFFREEAYVKELFSRFQIQLGNGSPVEPLL